MENGADVNKEVEVTAFTALPTERIPEYHRSYTALYIAKCMQHQTIVRRLLLANAKDDSKFNGRDRLSTRDKEGGHAVAQAYRSTFTPGPMT